MNSPTGFVGFQQWLDANKDKADEMAGTIGGQVEGSADKQQATGMLKTQGGQQALLGQKYGKQNATGLDAALAGAAGGGYFQQLQSAYGQPAQPKADPYHEQLLKQQAATNQAAIAKQNAKGAQGALLSEADKMRQEDASSVNYTGMNQTNKMTREQWANMHGMSLEQWIANGQKPAF